MINTERNQEIVKKIESGSTLGELEKEYGVKRQRIARIYYETSGREGRYLTYLRSIKLKNAREIRMNEVLFRCSGCGKDVTRRDAHGRSSYCQKCHNEVTVSGRDYNITLRCNRCSRKYHPYRSKKNNRNFCSRKCFQKSRIKIGSRTWWKRNNAKEMGTEGEK